MASGSIARVAPGVRRFYPRIRAGTIAKHGVLILVGLAVAYPFYFMVTSAFKDLLDATKNPPDIFPAQLHPENFGEAWSGAPWGRYFVNTITISIAIAIGELAPAARAGYGSARVRSRGKNVPFTLFLCALMVPVEG